MDIELYISGIEYKLEKGYQITDRAGQSATSTLSCSPIGSASAPVALQDVVIKENGVNIFFGIIQTVDPPTFSTTFETRSYQINVTSGDCIFANRIINKIYTNKYAHEIVNDIFDTILVEEGLAKGTISTSTRFYTSYKCDEQKVSDVLDDLGEATGAVARISSNRVFSFIKQADATTVTVPSLISGIKLSQNNTKVRTVQRVKGKRGEFIAQKLDMIAEIAALNGGSGKIEAAQSDTTITSTTDGDKKAYDLLMANYKNEELVTLTCHDAAAAAITNIWPLNFPDLEIVGDFSVVERTITDGGDQYNVQVKLSRNSNRLRYGGILNRANAAKDAALAEVAAEVDVIQNGNTSTIPDNVSSVLAVAGQDGITITHPWAGTGLRNTVMRFRYEISDDNFATWYTRYSTSAGYYYKFNRDLDGYPEAAALASWRVRVKAENMYAMESVEFGPNANGQAVDTDDYGTWLPSPPSASTRVNGRGVTLGWGVSSEWYGRDKTEIQIAKGYTVDGLGEIDLITDLNTLAWYSPALGVNPVESYENYKEGAEGGYLSRSGNAVTLSLPLYGQNETDPVSRDTPYYVRFRSTSFVPTTDEPDALLRSTWTAAELVYAQASSAQDIMRAWKLDDEGNKVKIPGALGAHQIFAMFLSAISANIGVITDGAMVGNENNLWAISTIYEEDGVTPKYWAGTVRMGGADQYLHITPRVSGGTITGYDIDFKVGNFTVTAVGSVINGVFEVRNAADNVTYFTVDPSNNGLVTVMSMLVIGEAEDPTDRITVEEAYGVMNLAFTGTGENNLEITQEGITAGSFEVEIVDGGKTVDDVDDLGVTNILRLAIGNGICVALFYYGSSRALKYTSDYSTWINITNVGTISSNTKIFFANNIFLKSDTSDYIYTSSDGINWTQGTQISGEVNKAGISFGNGFYLLATNTSNIYKSTDAITWTLSATISSTQKNLSFGAGIFVAWGDDVHTSTDGITWSIRNTFETDYAIFSGYSFIAFSGLDVYRSTDGITWAKTVSRPTGSALIKFVSVENDIVLIVDYDNNKYISIDDGNTLEIRVPFTANVRDISVSAGKFIIPTYSGLISLTARDRQTFRWRETSGAWSSAIKIIGTNQYELTPYGIKITFTGNKILTTGDLWTFEQGAIGGISVRDSAGVEYFAVRGGKPYKKIGATLKKLIALDEAVPIGATYWQLPGKSAPGDLFPGTVWTNISSSFHGAFFRAEGGNASAFGSGLQADVVGPHTHTLSITIVNGGGHQHEETLGLINLFGNAGITRTKGNYGGSSSGTCDLTNTAGAHGHSASGSANSNGGTENRPDNYTIRLWERTE